MASGGASKVPGNRVATYEKRIAPRVPLPPTDFVVFSGSSRHIRNLSVSGAFIEDPDPLPPGSPVYLELHLGKQRLPCSAVVRRAVPQVGMGVQFQGLAREVQQGLERYVNQLAKAAVEAEPMALAVKPTAAAPEAKASAESTADEGVSARLEKLSGELRALEDDLKTGEVEDRILREFRASVDQVRVTAWAVQQWIEKQSQKGDPYTVLPLITQERIRRATKLSQDLVMDIDALEIEFGTEGIEPLRAAIAKLHGRLERLFNK